VAASEDRLTQTHFPGYIGMTTQSAPVTHPNVVAHRGADIESDESAQSHMRCQHHARTQDTAGADAAICPHNDGRMNEGRELSAARHEAGDNPLFGCRITDGTNAQVRFSGRKLRGISQDFERHLEAVEGRRVGIQESADFPF
jgi:hypothetical protein